MVSAGQHAALASLTPPRLKDAAPSDELPLTVILHGLLGSSNNWRSAMARYSQFQKLSKENRENRYNPNLSAQERPSLESLLR
jgi:pimeloyl-ACP methyl ester carboxylesterase